MSKRSKKVVCKGDKLYILLLLIIGSFLSTKFYKNYAKTIDKSILLYYNAVNRWGRVSRFRRTLQRAVGWCDTVWKSELNGLPRASRNKKYASRREHSVNNNRRIMGYELSGHLNVSSRVAPQEYISCPGNVVGTGVFCFYAPVRLRQNIFEKERQLWAT